MMVGGVARSASLISSGSVTTMLALTGIDEQLYYCTTYKQHFVWKTDRWWPLGLPDPRYGFLIHDEFLATSVASQLGWSNVTAGSVATSTTRPGLNYIETSTALARSYMSLYGAGILLGGLDLYLETSISIPTLATVAEDFCVLFGLNDNTTYNANGACTDGAYITLNRAVNGAKWITNTTSNTTNTATNSTVTDVVAGTAYRLGIFISQTDGNVKFYQNGTLMATHTTNIPTGAGRYTGIMFKLDKTAGTGASNSFIDYFSAWGFFSGGARVA